MLWYKAWLETRARFLICLLGLGAVCGFFTHHNLSLALPDTHMSFYHSTTFYAHQYLTGMWLLSAGLLGLGGLLREKAVGTTSFTLPLPVSRGRLMGVRIAVGLAEAIVLAVVPWLIIYLIASSGGKPVPTGQAGYYLLLLLGGGLSYFALAVLVSCLVEGEYTAPAIVYGVVILTNVVPGNIDRFQSLSIFRLMSGTAVLDRRSFLLAEPVPWFSLWVCIGLTVLMLLASVQIVQRREF